MWIELINICKAIGPLYGNGKYLALIHDFSFGHEKYVKT